MKNKYVIGQMMVGTMEKRRHCGRLWPRGPVRGQTAKLLDLTGVHTDNGRLSRPQGHQATRPC